MTKKGIRKRQRIISFCGADGIFQTLFEFEERENAKWVPMDVFPMIRYGGSKWITTTSGPYKTTAHICGPIFFSFSFKYIIPTNSQILKRKFEDLVITILIVRRCFLQFFFNEMMFFSYYILSSS